MTMGSAPVGGLAFFTEDAISLELKASDKEGAIGELLDLLVSQGKLEAASRGELLKSILEREALGSTGIGQGLAIPHVKASPLVDELIGAFGRSSRGIEFGSSDGEPCSLFFLMVSPEDGVQEHLQILRKIASLGRTNEHFLRFLQEADSKAEIVSIFEEMDAV